MERGLSCVSLAACLGNIARLPLAAMLHGGVPFLLVYLLLMFLVGFPLMFLELGIGQIVQQGVTKTWRAVPMFKGKYHQSCIISECLHNTINEIEKYYHKNSSYLFLKKIVTFTSRQEIHHVLFCIIMKFNNSYQTHFN